MRDAGGLAHIDGVRVHQGLVQVRVERLAVLPVRRQAELDRDRLQRLGDGLEPARELAVLPGPADVVQYRQQPDEHAGKRLLPDRHPVALDPLAVVRVLRLNPLQIRGALGQPGRDLGRCPGPLPARCYRVGQPGYPRWPRRAAPARPGQPRRRPRIRSPGPPGGPGRAPPGLAPGFPPAAAAPGGARPRPCVPARPGLARSALGGGAAGRVSRTCPVTGSMRLRSRMTGPWLSSSGDFIRRRHLLDHLACRPRRSPPPRRHRPDPRGRPPPGSQPHRPGRPAVTARRSPCPSSG